MRKILVGFLLLSLLGTSVVACGSTTTAQAGATPAPSQHPLVGSWRFSGSTPFLYTFFSDGTALGTNEEGVTYHGAWQPLAGGRVTFVMDRLLPSRGTMGEGFQTFFEIGADPDRIALEDGFLQRIVPDLSNLDRMGTPPPEECLIAPRTGAELEALIGVATPGASTVSPPLPTALPDGAPASAETVAAILATVRELGACANAGDPRRLFALYTDRYLGEIGPYDAGAFVGTVATPEAEADRLSIEAVTDVQLLPDGRVAAIVVIGNRVDADPLPGRTAVYLFAGSGDGWLVDGVIEEISTPDGVRSVASVVGTPDP